MLISDVSNTMLKEIINPIEEQIKNVHTFEEASQCFCKELYNTFQQSIVLIRIFASVPFEKLPAKNKVFVQDLLTKTGNQSLLKDDTKVISLFGTYGKNNEWNSRLSSKEHIGIPLVSESFIGDIPMMYRLLGQLGINFSFDKSNNSVSKSTFSGLFYVKDAKSEVDGRGRKIIANQDFVQKYDVNSVFGFGGGYLITKEFFTAIVFLNEKIKMGPAETISLLGNNLKMVTRNFMENKMYFTNYEGR